MYVYSMHVKLDNNDALSGLFFVNSILSYYNNSFKDKHGLASIIVSDLTKHYHSMLFTLKDDEIFQVMTVPYIF